MTDSIENILVIQTAFPGDAILTLPMIERLKIKFPNSRIDVMAIPSTKELFKASVDIDSVIVMDKRDRHKSIRSLNKFIKELKLKSYSRLYSPHRSFRSAYLTLRLGVPISYGFDTSSFRFAYKNIIKYESKDHEIQRNLSLIGENTDNNSWKVLPKINFREEVTNQVLTILKTSNIENQFITIAPGSVWNTKRYPKEYYVELIKKILMKEESVILIGGESDQLLCSEIVANFSDNVLSFAGKLSIPATIQLLKYSKLLITNDSAPTHMGMCADIPVLTIYCSTVPEFGFYPYNSESKSVSYDNLYCKPCGIHGYKECPVKTFDCAYKLLPDKIMNEANMILNKNFDGSKTN